MSGEVATSNPRQTTLVEFQIRPESNSMQEWLVEWNKRALDARDGEPETIAYAAAVNVEDENGVLIFERYANGEQSLKTHSDRPAHKALMDVMAERNMTKRMVFASSFMDTTNYGWWSRPERSDAATSEGVILVVLGMRFRNDVSRDKFIDISKEHAGYCLTNEPDTLIYSGGFANADSDRADIKYGDLIFVMACTDMAAVDQHSNDPEHLALGLKFQDAEITPQPTFMKSYRTTGLGFLWR